MCACICAAYFVFKHLEALNEGVKLELEFHADIFCLLLRASILGDKVLPKDFGGFLVIDHEVELLKRLPVRVHAVRFQAYIVCTIQIHVPRKICKQVKPRTVVLQRGAANRS